MFVLQASSVKSNHVEVKPMRGESLENQSLETLPENYLALQTTVCHQLSERG